MSVGDDTFTYTLITPEPFKRKARKFFRKHPELRERFAALVATLVTDPFTPSLRTHALHGNLAGHWGVWLTYEYRVVVIIVVHEREIELIGIGTHDEAY